jgi:hypothetical protein
MLVRLARVQDDRLRTSSPPPDSAFSPTPSGRTKETRLQEYQEYQEYKGHGPRR